MIDLGAAFGAVVAALEDEPADYVIVGSTAAAAWGVLRATRDVDLVAILSSEAIERLLLRLNRDGLYAPSAEARRAGRDGGSFNVLHTQSGGKVDIFVPEPDDAFTESRMSRRIRAEVLGIPTWIATPEDIVLAKLRWRLESRSEVQWRDCVEIATMHELDREYMVQWAADLNVVSDLEELLGG